MYRFKTESPAETEKIGAYLARALLTHGVRSAFIAMRGEMGVGKTAFTRGFAAALGTSGVRSPTYTVVNEYRGGAIPLFHFDLYRLADEDELYAIGFDDYLASEGFCLCEWSERIPSAIPPSAVTVTLMRASHSDTARSVEIELPASLTAITLKEDTVQ